ARGNAGRTVDEVRTRNQCADRPGARPGSATVAARARRRGHRVIRREFMTLLGGAAAVTFCLSKAFAQSPSKRPLVACVVGGSKMVTDRFFGGFLQGMRELGYAEGRDYGFEVRYADGDVNRIPLLTEELLRLKPDVLVQGTMAGVIAARKLTDSIPIVSEVLTYPV